MLRLFWYDLFILSCIYLDVTLVIALLATSIHPFISMIGFLAVPVGFTIVSGSALLANQIILRNKTQRPFQFKQTVVIGAKKKAKKAQVEKKVMKPLQTAKPKVEFGFHTCPVHGIEKCAGNYLDLHSCNDTNQTSSKQIFWKEITQEMPAK
jgi:hypothetical protein